MKGGKAMTNQQKDYYQETAEVMAWILELDKETEQKVKKTIESIGIKIFFLNIDSLDFTDEVKKKLKVLKTVIEAFDGDIADVDFDEGGDQ
jgi:hypothetical protein